MNAIERFFLRARHWELFHLLTIPYLFTEYHVGGLTGPSADPIVAASITAVSMLLLMGWKGSIGLFLNTLKEPSVRSSTRFFLFAVFFQPAYFFVSVAFFSGSSAQASSLDRFPGYFSLFCVIYTAYFAAESLAMVEKGREVNIRDYMGPFILILFFPVGVWFIQPRINRLYAQTKHPRALRRGNQSLRRM